MIFWILVALVIAAAVFFFISELDDNYGSPFMMGFVTLFFGSIVGGLIFLLCCLFMPLNADLVSDKTHQLKALGNSNSTEGRLYFLGGGYVKDKRVLNFISQGEGGAIRVEQAEAEDATIYEGSADATVQVKHFDHNNFWLATWPIGDHDEYTFRIPSGSVVESYTLDNK